MVELTELGILVPIVEGKLYSYARMRLEYPDAQISSVYEEVPSRPDEGQRLSQQERWVLEHQYDILNASVIDRALKGMTADQRRMIELHYLDGWRWTEIAKKMHTSRRGVYRIREEVVLILAYEFGMLRGIKEAS